MCVCVDWGKMRYKFLIVVAVLVIVCCEFSDENQVQPPPVVETNVKKQSTGDGNNEQSSAARNHHKNEQPDNSEFIASIRDDNDEVSALKIVPAPDLTKERERRKGDDAKDYEDIANSADLLMLKQAKWLQKVVQDIGGIQYTIVTDNQEIEGTLDDDEYVPLQEPIIEKELTPEEIEAKEIYESAIALLNKTRPNKQMAYGFLVDAAEKGNLDAKALMAWAQLFGNPVAQDITVAKDAFTLLAEQGHSDGHMGLGFLYATGLALNVSQSKALVHYTLAALGGNSWAQMVIGYRYWSGITVAPSCEKALEFYRKVADKVAKGISFGGGAAVQRVRLLDELENGYTSGILDNDLIEYYQLLAAKGDVQAQVGLGQLHYQGGRGVDLDYKRAMHYFTQAANAGNAIAMAYLGKVINFEQKS